MVVVRAGWGFNITSTWQSVVICHRGFSRPWWLCVTTATNTFLMNYVQYIYISKATLSWQYQSSKIIDKRTYTQTNTLPKVSLAALVQIMDRQTDGQINSKIGWWTHLGPSRHEIHLITLHGIHGVPWPVYGILQNLLLFCRVALTCCGFMTSNILKSFVHLTTNCWYDMVVVRAGWGFNITSTWQSFVICHRGCSSPWWLCVITATNTFLMNYVKYIYISKATLSWQYQSSKIIDKRTYTQTNTLPKVSLAALGQIMDREITVESETRNSLKINGTQTQHLHHLFNQMWCSVIELECRNMYENIFSYTVFLKDIGWKKLHFF